MYTISNDSTIYPSFYKALEVATKRAKTSRKSIWILRNNQKVFFVKAPLERVIDKAKSWFGWR